MDIEKIRLFLEVVKQGSLSRAGESLYYTASGVWRSIASLEEETGLKLLIRSRNGVAPTSEAQELIPLMEELVRQSNLYQEKARKLKGMEEGSLTIGISYAGYFRLISGAIKHFADCYPEIRIKTIQATSTELQEALSRHEADVAIMTYRKSDFPFLELKKDPMVALVPENHPMASESRFPLKAFETEPFIAPFPDMETDYRRELQKNGIVPNIQYTTTDIFAAYSMVEAGLGVSLLNQLEIGSWQGKVKCLETEPAINLQIGILHPGEKDLSLPARRFLELLSERLGN